MSPLPFHFLAGRSRRVAPRAPGSPPRLLAYCASNVGMGHYCRLLRVIEEIRRRRPELDVLLATDAPDLALARRLGLATLQLPRFRFIEGTDFKERPDALSMSARGLAELRAQVLLAAGRAFDPNVVLADTNPHGKRDELLPLLRSLRRAGRSRVCLIMRDIPCPPGEQFKLSGPAASILRHAAYYDRLLVAGDARFFDPAAEHGWPDAVRARVRMVGFIVPEVAPMPRVQALAACPALDPKRALVVASFGGGWEAQPMLDRLLRGLEAWRRAGRRPVDMIVVTGPAVGDEALAQARARAVALGGVVVERFLEDFPVLLAQADLAILQAGSTPFQLLGSDVPILLTARDFKSREQAERARRLAALPGIRLLPNDDPAWDDPLDWLGWGLERPRDPRPITLCLNGVANAADVLAEELALSQSV